MTIAQFGKMAAKDTPGEGRSGHMIECIKNLIMQRGTCFPAPHRTVVSYLIFLALILGYGAISSGKKGYFGPGSNFGSLARSRLCLGDFVSLAAVHSTCERGYARSYVMHCTWVGPGVRQPLTWVGWGCVRGGVCTEDLVAWCGATPTKSSAETTDVP